MNTADREALRKRLEREDWDASIDDVLMLIVREVDQAVRQRARASEVWCHDCGVGLLNDGPVLCDGCVSMRAEEGMSRDDKRRISTWRRT
jgi:hypothetical protein